MAHDTLWLSDAHLRNRRGDEQFALRQCITAAKKHKVKQVIATGDLTDRQTNRSLPISFWMKQIDRLEEAGIAFWFLQGNHDEDEPPWLSAHRHAKHLHNRSVQVGPYTGFGLDFQPFGKLQEVLPELPAEANLLICHQAWSEWMHFDDVPQGDFAQVPGHFSHVFSGDYHRKKVDKCKNADGDKMICASVGATCAQKIDEPHEHYYCLIGDDGQLRFEKLHSRVYIEWPVMNRPDDLDQFMEEYDSELARAEQHAAANDYPETLVRPYLRVTYSHKLNDAVARVTKAVGERAILYWKEIPPEDKQPTKNKPAKVGKEEAVTPLSVLAQEVDKEKEPEVFELCTRLLQAPATFKEEFARWKAERLLEG